MKQIEPAILRPVIYFLPIMLWLLSSASCKSKSVCKENCKTIGVNGIVVNGMTNEPVAGIPMTMEWKRSIGWFNNEVITKLRSGSDGKFKATVVIDSSKFAHDYSILLALEETNKYLTNVDNYAAGMNDNSEASGFSNLRFTVYPKVPLTIYLKRTDHDEFGTLSVTTQFNSMHFDWVVENGEPGKIPARVTVYTCPDVYTKIEVSKAGNFKTNSIIDSIKCSKDKENVFMVNY